MRYKLSHRWRIIRFYITGWTFAFVFLTIVRGVGTIEKGSVQFDFPTSFLVALLIGPVFGTISAYIQILTEERLYQRISILRLLLIRTAFAMLFVLGLILVGYMIVTTFFGVRIDFLSFIIEDGSLPIYFYILVVDVFMVFLRQISLLLGGNNLSQLLAGKFYNPREEERIFMFLDLQSSTTLAERLGHIKYSRLIQDCFNDLGVVIEDDAEIYQYVGDEVILTWKMKNGLRNHNCLNAYYNFKKRLDDRAEYYKKTYGCQPFFKAGMNAGQVTVTEVGKYKKEIAYHGDTLNTAARIQGKCNEFKQYFLISGELKEALGTNGYSFSHLGGLKLRGKSEEVQVYAVHQSATLN